jgi:hypothetical protein
MIRAMMKNMIHRRIGLNWLGFGLIESALKRKVNEFLGTEIDNLELNYFVGKCSQVFLKLIVSEDINVVKR